MNKLNIESDHTLWQGHPNTFIEFLSDLFTRESGLILFLYPIALISAMQRLKFVILDQYQILFFLIILALPLLFTSIKTIYQIIKSLKTTYIITDKRISVINDVLKKTNTYFYYEVERIRVVQSFIGKLFNTRDIYIDISEPNRQTIVLRKIKEYENIYDLLTTSKQQNMYKQEETNE